MKWRYQKKKKANTKREAAETKKEEAVAKRAARTCTAEDCITFTRKDDGAAGWSRCAHCGALFCKKHKDLYDPHVSECAKDDTDEDSMGTVLV